MQENDMKKQKKILGNMVVMGTVGAFAFAMPMFSTAQEASTTDTTEPEAVLYQVEESMDYESATTTDEIGDNEVIVDDENMDDESMTLEDVIEESISSGDLSDDIDIVDGDIVGIDGDTVYIQTDDGIVSFDTSVTDSSDVRSVARGEKSRTLRIGDHITLITDDKVSISEEIIGQVIRLAGDVITILTKEGVEKTITMHPQASYTNAVGQTVSMSNIAVGDTVLLAVDDQDLGYQVVTGTQIELEDIAAQTDEESSFPRWIIALGLLLVSVAGWMVIRKK